MTTALAFSASRLSSADTALLQHAARLAPFGAFTQADLGRILHGGAASDSSRSVMATRTRQALETKGWIEPYTRTDPVEQVAFIDRTHRATVYRLTDAALDALDGYAVVGRTAVEIERSRKSRWAKRFAPSPVVPALGELLANRWALALTKEFPEGRLTQRRALGEFCLRKRLFHVQRGADGSVAKGAEVPRTPDAVLVTYRMEPDAAGVRSIVSAKLTLVEVEREQKAPYKHYRLFKHFNRDGQLMPLYSPAFSGYRTIEGQDPESVESCTLGVEKMQVVRISEGRYGRRKARDAVRPKASDSVSPETLVELAKLYYWDYMPKELVTPRYESLRKQLEETRTTEETEADGTTSTRVVWAGLGKERLQSGGTEACTMKGFETMLSKVEVVQLEVNAEHHTFYVDDVSASGRHSAIKTRSTLLDVFRAMQGTKAVVDAASAQPSSRETRQATSQGVKPEAQSVAQAKPVAAKSSSKLEALAERKVREQVNTCSAKVADAEVDGYELWKGFHTGLSQGLESRVVVAFRGAKGYQEQVAAVAQVLQTEVALDSDQPASGASEYIAELIVGELDAVFAGA